MQKTRFLRRNTGAHSHVRREMLRKVASRASCYASEVSHYLLLAKYACIVLDEAHERGVNTDILLGILSLAGRSSEGVRGDASCSGGALRSERQRGACVSSASSEGVHRLALVPLGSGRRPRKCAHRSSACTLRLVRAVRAARSLKRC